MRIERKEHGGKITIDFFSNDDLKAIVDVMNSKGQATPVQAAAETVTVSSADSLVPGVVGISTEPETPIDDRSKEEILAEENDEDLYSLKNFSI